MVGQRRSSLLTRRSRRLFTASHQVRAQDPVALREASEIIIGEAVQERCSGIVVQQMLFLQIQSSGNQRVVAFLRPEIWRFTDTIIVSSQGIDLIDHREHEAAAEASHKMRCAFGQHRIGCFFSVEICGFSCCLTCPIRHGAMQTCKRTRTTKTQSLSTLETFRS